MTVASNSSHLEWSPRAKLPKYYLPIQLLAFSLGYAAFLLVSFFDGGIGPLSGLGLFLAANLVLGVAAGTTSPSLTRALVVVLVTFGSAFILAFAIITLPSSLGVISAGLFNLVELRMALPAIFSVLTFPVSFLAILIGSAIHDRLGLPES